MDLPKLTVKKVLLIDDDEDEYYILNAAVQKISSAISVQYASSYKKETEVKEQPDITFLDLNMPEKDGFDVLTNLKKQNYASPIIVYSTTSNPRQISRAYELGADLFFTKPADLSKLVNSLKRIFSLDWHHPQEIRESFFKKGKYMAFAQV